MPPPAPRLIRVPTLGMLRIEPYQDTLRVLIERLSVVGLDSEAVHVLGQIEFLAAHMKGIVNGTETGNRNSDHHPEGGHP